MLFLHGGGWTQGRPSDFAVHAHLVALRGAVAWSAGYRLLGRERAAIASSTDDCRQALRSLRADEGVDAARVAIVGYSAGGAMGASIANADGAAALVLLNAGIDPAAVTTTTPPILLVHGTRDPSKGLVRGLTKAVDAVGVRFETVPIDGAHTCTMPSPRDPDAFVAVVEPVLAFLASLGVVDAVGDVRGDLAALDLDALIRPERRRRARRT